MKRKFYFIKDSVTGNFYEGKSADDISTFDKAAVYFQHKNAEKKIKEYIDDTKEALETYKKEYSQYWNGILSGTGEIKLDESEDETTE